MRRKKHNTPKESIATYMRAEKGVQAHPAPLNACFNTFQGHQNTEMKSIGRIQKGCFDRSNPTIQWQIAILQCR